MRMVMRTRNDTKLTSFTSHPCFGQHVRRGNIDSGLDTLLTDLLHRGEKDVDLILRGQVREHAVEVRRVACEHRRRDQVGLHLPL